MSMIRVLIADDHKMVREGLRRILEFDGEIQVIDEADNGEECIKKIRSSKPDIVLLDINMPVMNGIEALQEIRKKKLKTKVIILTVHNEIEYLLRAVDIGIDGYVLKDSDAHELIRAVTSVYEGDKFIQPSLIPLLNSKEVLKLVAVGMFNKEIGVELGISERTVKNHLSSIFKKIDSSDRTQAAVFAIRNGLVDIK